MCISFLEVLFIHCQLCKNTIYIQSDDIDASFIFFVLHPKASWFRELKAKKQPSKMRQMGGFLLRALPEPQPAELERSTPVPESTEVTFINNTPLPAKTKNNRVFRLLRVLSIFGGHKHCYFSLQPRKHCGGRVMRVPAP